MGINLIMMTYALNSIYILILVMSFGLTIYNFLFVYQAKKTESEINITIPSLVGKLLIFNLIVSFLAGLFVFILILKIIR